MLFDPNENNNNESKSGENPISDNDDLVDSSFAVSFKSNDPVNTVEGKLKENKDNLDDGFKDEFDDFEFDSSISAFKPLNNADAPKEEKAETSFAPFKMAEGVQSKKPEAKPEAVKTEEAAKMPEPSAPVNEAKPASPAPSFPKDNGTFEVDNKAKAVPAEAAPVFDDNDKDLMDFGGLNTEDPSKDKLFNSGNDLDFATSESNKPKSPFAQKPQTQAPQAKPAPSKAEDKAIETFGKVNSGMDAFKTPEAKPQEKVMPKAPYRPQPSAAQKPAAPVSKEAPVEKKPEASPVAPAAAAESKPEAKAPVKPEVKASAPASNIQKPETAAKPAPQSNSGRVLNATPATHRPGAGGESRPAASPRPAPAKRPTNPAFENAAARQERNAEAAKKAQLDHEQQKKITPVTPAVNKKRRKSDKPVREPGKGGVITLAVIIVLFIGILWVLDNTEKLAGLFNGKKNVETVPTRIEQTEESETTAVPSETTAAPETSETTTTETTTATTEATTETSETTTEATTEATTTEATTTATTTEATTTTTTTAEATTTTTTASSSTGGVKVTNFKTKLNHFSTTAGGFKFDITLTNKSDKDASLTLSLKEVDITIRSDAEITDVTCDQFTFTSSGNNKYVGVPNDIMIPAGETVTYTVYVSTSSSVSHYGYDYCYFDWK